MRRRIDMTEVETATKIRGKYLRALENEEWDLLPGPTFVKSFLRTYAEYLGLDARLLVEEYRQRYERPSTQDLTPFSARRTPARNSRRSNEWRFHHRNAPGDTRSMPSGKTNAASGKYLRQTSASHIQASPHPFTPCRKTTSCFGRPCGGKLTPRPRSSHGPRAGRTNGLRSPAARFDRRPSQCRPRRDHRPSIRSNIKGFLRGLVRPRSCPASREKVVRGPLRQSANGRAGKREGEAICRPGWRGPKRLASLIARTDRPQQLP